LDAAILPNEKSDGNPEARVIAAPDMIAHSFAFKLAYKNFSNLASFAAIVVNM
jgi:hypothetical protein